MKNNAKLKIVTFISVLVLLCVTISSYAYAANEGYYYSYTVSNGEATIIDCNEAISGDVTIPSTLGGYPVTGIGSYAFYNCTGLTSITIPDSVTRIGVLAFNGCTGLTSIEVDENNEYYSSQDGALFNKNKTEIIQYPIGNSRTEYAIPGSVTSIGDYAFYSCIGLTSVTIPDSVTSIGSSVFKGCTNLENMTLPFAGGSETSNTYLGYIFGASDYSDNSSYVPASLKSIAVTKSINSSAFYNCTGLTSITIPDSVTRIGVLAFNGCTGLTSVTIGNSVTSIGSSAFKDCGKLRSIAYAGSSDEWGKIQLGKSAVSCKIYYNHPKPHDYSVKSETSKYLVSGKLCTDNKVYCYKCSMCDEKSTDTYTVSASEHSYVINKATFTKNGKITCSKCSYEKTVYSLKTVALSKTTYTYNGKVQKPTVTVKDSKGNTLVSGTDYTVTYSKDCKSVGTYTVKVTFKGNYSGTKAITYTIIPKAPSSLKASQTDSTITLTWGKVTGASKYEVYMYNASTKKYEKKATVTDAKATIKSLKAGTTYKFKVLAMDKSGKLKSSSAEITTATQCKKPTVMVTSPKKGYARVEWNEMKGATSYTVYYSTSKNGKYKKLGSTTSNTSFVKGKLNSEKIYYFKVVANRKVSSSLTVKSEYSSVKSVKVK